MRNIQPVGWLWFALLAAICVSLYSAHRAMPPDEGGVAVAAVLTGASVPRGGHARSFASAGACGQAVYAYHTAVYGEHGYVHPWDNYLVLCALNAPVTRAFSLKLPANTFIMHPTPSPDGRVIAFKVGKTDTTRTAFALYLLDTELEKVTPVGVPGTKVCGWRALSWSPDSRYLAYLNGDYHWGNTHYAPPSLCVYDR
ncbi:MAG: hypothetical protein BWY76_01590 [bacterium ADurb.Bin429]|nr:MAG: hypothetical protein BWY76_01590 [bacterium ADurb.Bin429]